MSFEVTVTHLSGPRINEVETFATLPVRIGRSEECQLRFPEDETKISADHAEIRTGPDGGLQLRDLDSRNGIWLNGAKVNERAPLPNHAVIEVGVNGPRLRLTYEQGAGGVSFSALRKEKTGKIKRGGKRPMADTEEVIAYSELDLGSDEGGALPLGLEPKQAAMIGGGVLLVVLGLLYAIFS